MDELTLLRGLGERAREPREAAVDGARAALFARIREEADPGSAPAPSTSPSPRPRRRGAVRWSAGGALLAGALAAGLVLTGIVGPGSWHGTADPAAADALHAAALRTVEVVDPVVGPGQYLRVETRALHTTLGDDGHYQTLTTERLYLPADREDAWVLQRLPAEPVPGTSAASRRQAERQRDDELGTYGPDGELMRADGGRFAGGRPLDASDDGLASLPRDPERLLDRIREVTKGAGRSPEGQALVWIADTLRHGTVPADLRAALLDAAALIPGVTITDRQATLDGRTGIAIGRYESADGTRQDIVIDPGTGQVIGEREVQVEENRGDAGAFPARSTISWTSVTTSVVDEAPAGGTADGRPAGDG
jgi:hypothetical protein